MKLEDILKIVFRIRYGHYEYYVMPFGVSNSRCGYVHRRYLIYSKSDEEHAEQLKVVLQTLKEKRLYVKLSKCEFWL